MFKVKYKKEVKGGLDTVLTAWALEVYTLAGFIESAEEIKKEVKVKNASQK